jgi:hypothetical protein
MAERSSTFRLSRLANCLRGEVGAERRVRKPETLCLMTLKCDSFRLALTLAAKIANGSGLKAPHRAVLE